MKKPLLSLSLRFLAIHGMVAIHAIAVLPACSGKPAGFQGDTASISGTSDSGDAGARNFGNRDGEGDATGMPGSSEAKEQTIETQAIEMSDTLVYEGAETTISVPAASEASNPGASSEPASTPSSEPAATTNEPAIPSNDPLTPAPSEPVTTPPGEPVTTTPSEPVATTPTEPVTTPPGEPVTTTPSEPAPTTPTPTPSEPAPTTPAPITLIVTVPSTSLRAGSAPMQATATISGQTTAANVIWSVSSSGMQSAGTIDENGLYTAPASGGGYDITISAALVDDPSVTASVVIKIVAPEQIFVGCQQGSEFFPITADVYQLPVNTTKLPDFSAIGPKLTTVCMDQYNVAPRDWSTGFPGVTGLFEWFALRTTTHLVVPSNGTYTFKLNSDDGAKLYLNGQLLINNDGQHAPTAKEASITLTAGEYALAIDYFQGPRYQIALELYWKTPGSSSYVYVPKASFK